MKESIAAWSHHKDDIKQRRQNLYQGSVELKQVALCASILKSCLAWPLPKEWAVGISGDRTFVIFIYSKLSYEI